MAVPREALEVEGDSLATFTTVGTDTGQEVARRFCRECGSPIVSLLRGDPEVALIKAGHAGRQVLARADSARLVRVGAALGGARRSDAQRLPRGVPA